jgi:hypothetical protein
MKDQCTGENITYTTNKRKEYLCPQRDSNSRFQQLSDCRPKPLIVTPPGSAKTELDTLLRMQCADIFIIYHRTKLLIPYHHEKVS